MEHKNNGTWKEEAKAFFSAYGYEPMEHDEALKIYIDGIPCEFWMNEEGYHFSTPDGIEAIEPTWKCISALRAIYHQTLDHPLLDGLFLCHNVEGGVK